MGFFRNLIRTAAPIVGGVLGGPAGAAIGGGIAGMIGSGEQARGQERVGQQAGQTALGGFNYMQGSPIGQQYLPAGGAAAQQQAALLGIGGDQAAANQGYQNYLNSIGYQGQMQAGQQAITTSAAARGLLGSGSTAKSLTRFGQQLGKESFGNYLGQLGGVAGQGLQAGQLMGQQAAQGYGDAGRYQYGAGMGATESRASGWDQLIGGLGQGYDAWQAGRANRAPNPNALPQVRPGAAGTPPMFDPRVVGPKIYQ